MTTSRRLSLFERTLLSLRQQVTDLDLVGELLHLDDGSAAADLERMQRLFANLLPHVPRRSITDFRFSNRAHHAYIMQTWHDLVSSADYVFHCEDDWEFTDGGHLISDAVSVMEAFPEIGQVGFWRKPPACGVEVVNRTQFWKWPHDPTVEFAHRLQDEDEIDVAWPHFSLRPSVIRCAALRRTGNFRLQRFFEHAFARRWTEAGFVSAFLAQKCCYHLAPGKGQSVYERSGTLR